jgi:hypothetical protein
MLGRLAEHVEAAEHDRGHTSMEEPDSSALWIVDFLEA